MPNSVYPVRLYGNVREERDEKGRRVRTWEGGQRVLAVAYDTPVVGWGGRHVNTLRLWSAQSGNLIDLEAFNRGDYMRAVQDQTLSQSITRVLYPNDATEAGQELRLKQEYFFTSASLQDILRRHLSRHADLRLLPDKVAIQLNDTHPAIAVPELMRLLIDEHGLDWATAWTVTRGTIHYTNHTLMPEALERWSVELMERLLPRQLQLIYEINAEILSELRKRPDNVDPFLSDVSLIDESYGRFVRMGHLAFLGARKVNGVSALHGELMKQTVFHKLHRLFPDRITAITNGVTPRRWVLDSNPELADLITETLGHRRWIADLERLEELAPRAADPAFQARFAAIKQGNKERLASLVGKRHDVSLPTDALFDVHIKRIHEYKRQLLNILEAVATYADILDGAHDSAVPRVKIFAGKAAPSYQRAKLIIKLINDVAVVVNAEPKIGDRLKILFMPNYNVSLAQILIPGADLSEQISTAGMEASGTGNMKFGLNGALTIGTLDGANIEMLEHVGPDNIFIFGLTAAEVAQTRHGGFSPRTVDRGQPATCPCLRADRGRSLLARRPGALPPAPGRPRQLRPFPGDGGFRQLCLSPAPGRDHLRRSGSVVAQGRAQHGAHGLVLQRPHGPRLCARDLARATRHLTRECVQIEPRQLGEWRLGEHGRGREPRPYDLTLVGDRTNRKGRLPREQERGDPAPVVVEMELAQVDELGRLRFDAGLLAQFPDRGGQGRFAPTDATAGQVQLGPVGRAHHEQRVTLPDRHRRPVSMRPTDHPPYLQCAVRGAIADAVQNIHGL